MAEIAGPNPAEPIVLFTIGHTRAILNLRKSNVLSIQCKSNRQINVVERPYADDTFRDHVPGIKIPGIENIPNSC
jgi:hypothetical protein